MGGQGVLGGSRSGGFRIRDVGPGAPPLQRSGLGRERTEGACASSGLPVCVRRFKSIGVHGRIGDCAGRREVPESLEGCSTRGEATPIRKTQVGSAVLESAEGNCGSLRQIFVQAEPRFPPSVLEHVLLLQRKEEEHRSAYLV